MNQRTQTEQDAISEASLRLKSPEEIQQFVEAFRMVMAHRKRQVLRNLRRKVLIWRALAPM